MAKYREIKGVTVQTRDTDPVLNVNSWSSGGSMVTDRARMAGDGPQTAFITFGGTTPSPGTQLANTETYDGSSFSETGDLSLGRTDLAGAGTTTATLAVAGSAGTGLTNTAEAFGGSSWTSSPSCNTARYQLAGFGTQTNMVIAGGSEPSFSNKTEEWNGSSWAEKNEINTARQGLNSSGAGVYTAGIIAGGRKAHPSNPGQESNDTETWNGTSWTEVNELNEAKQLGGVFGTSTSAIYAGGADTATLAAVESWDGTSWSETSDLATARYYVSSGGASGTSGIIAGGTPGAATEEWSLPPPTAAILNEGDIFLSAGATLKGFSKDVSSGTFASGGNLNSEHLDASAGGATQSSFMIIAGYPNLTIVEQYDGSSWSEVGDVNVTRQLSGASAQAPAPTMLFFGGNPSPGFKLTELYDGTSWTEKSDLNTNREYSGGGAGTSTSALCVGGYGSPAAYLANNESWDGTSWTEVGDLNVARYGGATGGTQNSARCVAGAPPTNPPAAGDKNEGWDGTTWTEATENSDNSAGRAGFGANKDFFMVASGNATASSEFWNGTSWTETADTAGSGQRFNMGGGTTVAGIIGKCSGPTPQAKSTEEFNCDNGLLTINVS